MRFVWIAAVAMLLAGCTSTMERQARDAGFVGKPQTELTKLLGPPVQTRETGGMAFLTYQDAHAATVPGNPFCFGPGPFCDGTGFPPPKPATLVCHSTFMVSGGFVRGYSISGDGCA